VNRSNITERVSMATDWERRLADWHAELDLVTQLEDIRSIALGRAEAATDVVRHARKQLAVESRRARGRLRRCGEFWALS
jgi:hypothetical protein